MAESERLSLDELAGRCGVPARQIRELIRVGVLPAASSGGRGATYGPDHLLRLGAWKRLREQSPASTTSAQLRILIDRLGDAGLLGGVADGSIPVALVDDGESVASFPTPAASSRRRGVPARDAAVCADDAPAYPCEPSSPAPSREVTSSREGQARNEDALDYLRSIGRLRRAPARVAMNAATMRPTLEVDLGASRRPAARLALERLRGALEDYVAAHCAAVRVGAAKSETWQRVAAGRDLEIAARGPLDDEDVALLETVACLLQQAIYRRRQQP